jgi:hypothetical protein
MTAQGDFDAVLDLAGPRKSGYRVPKTYSRILGRSGAMRYRVRTLQPVALWQWRANLCSRANSMMSVARKQQIGEAVESGLDKSLKKRLACPKTFSICRPQPSENTMQFWGNLAAQKHIFVIRSLISLHLLQTNPGGFWNMARIVENQTATIAITVSRTRLWLAWGWGCRGRRLSNSS